MSQRTQADVPPDSAYYDESPYGACEPCFSPRLGFQCEYTVPDTRNQDWLFYDPGTPDYTPPSYDPVSLSAVIKGPEMKPGDVFGPCSGDQLTNCYYSSIDDCVNIAFDPAAGDPRYQVARAGPKFQGAMLKASREAKCPKFVCDSTGYKSFGGKIIFTKDACTCLSPGSAVSNVAINLLDSRGPAFVYAMRGPQVQPAIEQLMSGPESLRHIFPVTSPEPIPLQAPRRGVSGPRLFV